MTAITLRITASLCGDELCCVSVARSATVKDLKNDIQQVTSIPSKAQQLLFGKRVLREATCVDDFIEGDPSDPVELSLLQVDPSDNPSTRARAFESAYMYHSMGRGGDRWDFHHSRQSHETMLDRGMSSRKRLFITLFQDAEHTATFNVCSLDFPLRELFDTFAEQLGVPVVELRFSFQGRRLGRDDTPHLCSMEPCTLEKAYVIQVDHVTMHHRRYHLLTILNGMGDAVNLAPRSAESICQFVIGADNLLRGLAFLEVEDLLSTTVVNTFWFHATQRLSLMLQLRHGDVAFTSAPPQDYTAWLNRVYGHSQQLAFLEAQSRHEEVKVWRGLHVSKESAKYQPYTFVKAAGCTQMKTVSLTGLSAEFEQQWLSLHSSKAKFMAECKARCTNGLKSCNTATTLVNGTGQSDGPSSLQEQQTQELPPPDSQNFTAEAVSPKFRADAIELFRRYFSPDMYFIFPLIVGQEAAFGLDFRSTTTTLFFGPQHSGQEALAPAGACSWRFRCPLLPDAQQSGLHEIAMPMSVLEVLFIAVWQEERDQVHGGTLISELESKAREAGIGMLYVEIGYEQPKARRFWRKQGFGKAIRRGLPEAEKEEILEAEDNEDVPMQFIALPDAQFEFFDSNCLRFGDTAQYVKLLC